MSDSNGTLHYEFSIVGFPGLQEHYIALFIFFLILFLAIIMGNMLILVLVALDHRLHTPMYFFLWNLSLLDILLTSTVIPKLLAVLLRHDNTISFSGCFVRFLVAAMAYDRYAALVKPLHYNTIINTKICIIMTVTVWGLGFLAPLPSTVLATQVNLTLLIAMFAIYVPFLYVLWTYCRIIASVMKLKTMESRKKAFSMCSSHVMVVLLYYVSAAVVYIGLRVENIHPEGRIFIGTVYNFLTPLLNPIIYSLRNEKIKAATNRYFRFQALHSVKNTVSIQ
nr:PREDICTED: olfactory receptor 6N2-like [Lepisosteus oculatus]